ncbi:MAG TPA: alcohol dehydrogenase catalytic domain-containing protein [Acidimicrobiales bacterium]|nr:alcohol dehydrogenase catalytic domain-containing protein [Acidimicrobiales bacterium]
MKRAVWTEGGLEVAEGEPPPLPEGWVRVQVAACGICGSDLHIWHGGVDQPLATRPVGTTPGHEVAGTVVEATQAGLPEAVFAVNPNVTCGRCDYCVTGRPNLCRRGGFGIGLGRPGGLAEYVDAPVANLFPVADTVSPVAASLTEPLAVALRGVSLARLAQDSAVLVLGGGTIGLLAALLARDRASTVAVTTRHAHQRQLASSIGATPIDPDEAVAWGREHRPDVVIETVGGQADTVGVAVRACARGGRIVVLGVFGTVPVDMGQVMFKELELIGSFCYGTGRRGQEFAAAANLLPRYAAELDGLQTHRFALDDVESAFSAAADKGTGSVKVTVVP